MNLRILHISHPVGIPVKGYGGTERVVYSLAKMQAENGHEISIMAGKPSVIPHVRDISFVDGRNYMGRRSVAGRILTAYSLKAILKSRSHEFDIVHNHISAEAIFLSELAKSSILTTLHCPITLRKFWPFVITSVSRLFPRKTKFVTISKRAFQAYLPFYGKDLVTHIHNGIDVSNIPFNSSPKRDQEIQIGFLGKLIRDKRPHIAVQIADIIHRRGYDVKLFIMGKLDFPLSNYAKILLRTVKQRKYVALLPNMDTVDVYRVLGNCDVLLNPAFEIGLIMSQLEAMALGTPVVGFVNGSAEEVVSGGQNGYLGVDLNDLANGCVKALDISRTRCRRFVEENFSEQEMYESYLQVYRSHV